MFFYLIHWWGEIFFRGGYPPLEKKIYDPPLAPKVYDPPLAILAVSTYGIQRPMQMDLLGKIAFFCFKKAFFFASQNIQKSKRLKQKKKHTQTNQMISPSIF